MATIVVVHTGPVTVQPLKDQFAAQLPDVRMINIVDDSLLNDVRSAGHLTPEVTGRLYSYMSNAQAMGADFILNACSSVGEAVDTLRGMIRTPIIKIDETMAQEASRLGTRIGVVATVKTTLEPTVRLIRKKAAEAGREISVVERVAEEAFAALGRRRSASRRSAQAHHRRTCRRSGRGGARAGVDGAARAVARPDARAGPVQPAKRRGDGQGRAVRRALSTH